MMFVCLDSIDMNLLVVVPIKACGTEEHASAFVIEALSGLDVVRDMGI
jgi:hypothetical protein